MLAHLGIDRYLQGHEEEFPVQSAREQPEHRAFPESIEHLAPCRAQPGKHLRQPQAAVMSIAREPGTPDGGGDVIQGCPQSRVPEGVADVELPRLLCARQMAIELCVARNPRIAVDAKLLEGNEVGAEVALFESANPDTMRSEERRVGKECRSRWSPYHEKQQRQLVGPERNNGADRGENIVRDSREV